MTIFKNIFIIAMAVVLSACGATIRDYRICDPQTIKVVQGPLQKFETERVPIAITTTEAATAGIAANNVGNSTAQGALLVVGILDDIVKPKYQTNLVLYILDDKSGDTEKIVLKGVIGGVKHLKVGHRIRVIYRSETDIYFANLTLAPELELKTQ